VELGGYQAVDQRWHGVQLVGPHELTLVTIMCSTGMYVVNISHLSSAQSVCVHLHLNALILLSFSQQQIQHRTVRTSIKYRNSQLRTCIVFNKQQKLRFQRNLPYIYAEKICGAESAPAPARDKIIDTA
jgi:hypothetical protein